MSISKRRSTEGLEVVQPSSDPVVVSGPQWKSALHRGSSMKSPQAQYSTLPESYNQSPPEVSGKFSEHLRGNGDPEKEVHTPQEAGDRRISGLRRKVFVWIAAVIAAICVIGAVLGGVLGTMLNKNGDDSNDDGGTSATDGLSFEVRDRTGVAMVNPYGSSTLYAYYMDGAGMLLETTYENGTWDQMHLADAQEGITKNITGDAPPGSPIAAVSFTLNGIAYRQIFFFDSQGIVTTMNHTESTNWSAPYRLLSDQPSRPETVALAACADTSSTGLDGVRVYYGSGQGHIQEIGMDFSEMGVWFNEFEYDDSDASAGVGCTITNDNIYAYVRNETNGALQQWSTAYTESGDWSVGPSSLPITTVAKDGSITATSDGQTTDYLFFHSSNNTDSPSLAFFIDRYFFLSDSEMDALQQVPIGYFLSATWAADSQGQRAAVVLNQQNATYTDLYFSSVQRSGQSQEATTETGR